MMKRQTLEVSGCWNESVNEIGTSIGTDFPKVDDENGYVNQTLIFPSGNFHSYYYQRLV